MSHIHDITDNILILAYIIHFSSVACNPDLAFWPEEVFVARPQCYLCILSISCTLNDDMSIKQIAAWSHHTMVRRSSLIIPMVTIYRTMDYKWHHSSHLSPCIAIFFC